jgi:two-component system, NtrC family, sensor kinase
MSLDESGHVIGMDFTLTDLLGEHEVRSLFESCLEIGACRAVIEDSHGTVIHDLGESTIGSAGVRKVLMLEGEAIGHVVVWGDDKGTTMSLCRFLSRTIHLLMAANLKRALTTDVHTAALDLSYDELIEANRGLKESEQRYRDLAATLEEKVVRKTDELHQTLARLVAQEKMASIGQLAAGVAHEINNPLSFIISNLKSLNLYQARFMEMLSLAQETILAEADHEQASERFSKRWKERKMDEVRIDAQAIIDESLAGAVRVSRIVSDLRGVSHIDDCVTSAVDLNIELDRVLGLLAPLAPAGAQIIKSFGNIPALMCRPAMLSQAFMNIILNALQSRTDGLCVTISTQATDDYILVKVVDNGPGIADGIKDRIFEPFFTTKQVGSGIGLGLTTAYEIITSHNGVIEVEQKNGAAFTVKLPLKG